MDRNEAIEILRKDRYQFKEALETLIPELKESENENDRIRNNAIEIIRCSMNGVDVPLPLNIYKECIDLLEKLGEQKSVPFKAEHGKYYYCIKDYFSGGKKQASKGDVVQALRGLPIMGLDDASEFFLPVNDIQLNNDIVHNVSPKFKVGDWVVFLSTNTLQIVKIDLTSNYYWFNDGSFLAIVDEDCLRPWTIEDAKDGDVLAEHETIVLFKKIEGLNIKCYCTYHYLGFNPTFYVDTLQNKTPYHPATKELRDKLEKAITEAGYEWDAKKKELKKIEQKPTDKIEPKFEIGDLITNGILVGKIDEIHKLGYHAYFGDHYADVPDIENWHKWTIQDTKDGDVLVTKNKNIFIFKSINNCVIYDYCGLYFGNFVEYSAPVNNPAATQLPMDYVPATKEQCDLLFQKMKEAGYEWDAKKKELNKIEQKPTCGGDDEKLINNVIELINDGSLDRDEKDFYIEKLKSLKERVQSNGEWTEEDEQTVRFYEAYTNNQVGNWPQNKVLEMKSKFNNWVKKVKYRVQPQWKPSKEQLTALEHVSSEYIGSWQPEMLTLFDDLKTLYDNYNKNEK